ncbi:MAG: SulP family inorganic anion transporter, partial [Marinobacter sp.]|uniref:SulP family inorganic anion transporter n=1 Tax=Marinobacter sp. TaxID=50741 RepID=UPI00299F401A
GLVARAGSWVWAHPPASPPRGGGGLPTPPAAWYWQLEAAGVNLVGAVPSGLPSIRLPMPDSDIWRALLPAAVLISLVGFVESVSVAQTLAAKRRQRIDPNSELMALGLANVGSGMSGGSPVSGGFSRSVVNFEAGAQTPIAGILTAAGIAITTLTLTGLLAFLPKATLAATIIVAVSTLIDLPAIRRTLNYSKADGAAMLATIVLTLAHGVEAGITAGVAMSLGLYLYRTSRPHSAVVGRIPGTEHFRNVQRHRVETDDETLFLRVDGSLYFANARYLEDTVLALVASRPEVRNLVLACQAVNDIDASALESLEAINSRLADAGIRLYLAEVKGPVMDRLRTTDFYRQLRGRIFLSTYEAWNALVTQPRVLAAEPVASHPFIQGAGKGQAHPDDSPGGSP